MTKTPQIAALPGMSPLGLKPKTYTAEQIAALTDADVAAAKERAAEARKTRKGVSTIDYFLTQVDGKTKTLEMAKSALLSRLLAGG